MKFTFDWLLDHLKTTLSYEEIAEKLTALGIEVEEIIDNNKKFENFVVGFIKSAEQHPNADRLRVCKVDIGSEVLNIVCGAKNAREGIFVAVAKIGAIVPVSNEPLKKGVIRGIESQGMMCSTDELLIEDDGTDGIIELGNENATGTPLAVALRADNVVFDVSLTPNRSDCFSVRGIARDLAACGAGELLPLNIKEFKRTIENPAEISIETEKCDYFSLTAVKNISGTTPDYIARRLKAIGQKLIFPAVDIANYVCIDVGQPLHVFDMDKSPKSFVVRDAKQGEKLDTLDGNETILPEGAIVVSDGKNPLSVAGIKGGVSSGFSENTRNIMIEGAYFDKVAIAKTGQHLRVISDSRTRFERGIDPQAVDQNVDYTISLLSSICGCEVSNRVFAGKIPSNENIVTLTFEKFQALTDLSEEEFSNSAKILESLGMKILSQSQDEIKVQTPSYRHDLSIEEDLIEEILRIIGFDKVQSKELEKREPITRRYAFEDLSDALMFNGFFEVQTFSFVDFKTAELFANGHELIKIKDALTNDFSTLRPSTIASHLKSIKNSQNKSQKNSRFFEIGKRFYLKDQKVCEENTLTLTMSENKTELNWREPQKTVSVFDVKEILERLLSHVGANARLSLEAPAYFHPGRRGSFIIKKDTVVAQFGEIHPSILSQMDVKGPVVCFELFLDQLPEVLVEQIKKPLALSPYQPVCRDFSFIVGKQVSAGDLLTVISKLHIDFIKDVKIFDIYESEAIGEDKKAIAFEVTLQSDKSTLTDDQITEVSEKIKTAISKNLRGVLRDQ